MPIGEVPDTNNFSLSEVIDGVIIPSPASLVDCFAAANAAGFDSNYVGDKDRQSNFRNYKHNPASISINITSKNVAAGGETFNISVTASGSWSSSVSDTWISRSPSSGSGNATVSVTVAQNNDGFSRLGSISFTLGSTTVTCNINQAG